MPAERVVGVVDEMADVICPLERLLACGSIEGGGGRLVNVLGSERRVAK